MPWGPKHGLGLLVVVASDASLLRIEVQATDVDAGSVEASSLWCMFSQLRLSVLQRAFPGLPLQVPGPLAPLADPAAASDH